MTILEFNHKDGMNTMGRADIGPLSRWWRVGWKCARGPTLSTPVRASSSNIELDEDAVFVLSSSCAELPPLAAPELATGLALRSAYVTREFWSTSRASN